MEKSPAFQWYPKEFLADGNVMEMNMTERGVYITLISVCWIEGGIPADPGRLARKCSMKLEEFLECWKTIEPTFRVDPRDASILIHPRLQKELRKQAEWRRKSAEGGVKSGRTRRDAAKPKPDTDKASKGGSRVVEPSANQTSTNGEPNTNTPVSGLQSPVFGLPLPGEEETSGSPTAPALAPAETFKRRDDLISYLKAKLGEHPLANPRGESAAALWLVKHGGYSNDECIACLDAQWCDEWRKKVGWLTVKAEIGRFLQRAAPNGHGPPSTKTAKDIAVLQDWVNGKTQEGAK